MLKKIGHIILVLLLLISTMGMSINMHFCKHKLYDIAFFGHAKSCCSPSNTFHINHHHCQDSNLHKKDCENDCENETIHVDKINDFVSPVSDFHFEGISLSTLFTYFFVFADFNSTSAFNDVEVPDLNISPPGIKVVLSLLQTYLN